MQRILILLTVVVTGLWAGADLPELLAREVRFWPARGALVVLSGLLALAWMTAAVVLAVRPPRLEARLGGLDRLYRLHKWSGTGAGILVFGHWAWETLPKQLVELGWLAAPAGRGPHAEAGLAMELAEDLGEWAGYALVALVLVALFKAIPYRWFRLVHKAFGVIFLMGAYHGVMMLQRTELLMTPVGALSVLLAAGGSVAAVLSLSGRIGRRRRLAAEIAAVAEAADGTLDIACRVHGDWPGHRPGQFLLASFDRREGPHPFTIASAWADDGRLRLLVKPLGDYTRGLGERLRPGQPVTLEGPYGGFDFADDAPRQFWIAGGIGITPFLARLEWLARRGGSPQPVELLYCVSQRARAVAAGELAELCQRAGVRLELRATDEQGRVAPEDLARRVGGQDSVWFCGPRRWGRQLQRVLSGHGLPPAAFHQEWFEFR